jgi:hypothetical protein
MPWSVYFLRGNSINRSTVVRFRINEPQSVDQETLGSDIAGGVRRDDLYNLYGVAQ